MGLVGDGDSPGAIGLSARHAGGMPVSPYFSVVAHWNAPVLAHSWAIELI